MHRHKELLGMRISENEGVMLWINARNELQYSGVNNMLIAYVDGLKGFPDAVNTIILQAHVQLCIAHMAQNSTKYVSWKDYKAVVSDLKPIYQSVTEQKALLEFDKFCSRWDNKYPKINYS